MQYSLDYFIKTLQIIDLTNIDPNIINNINSLASQVGAPEYNKTPQFKDKINIEDINYINRRRKKFMDTKDDWDNIKTFQTTEFQKKEGLDKNIFQIRKYLNMLTDRTFDKLKPSILNEIQIVYTTKTENDFNTLCENIYEIVSKNILYSSIYTKLYKILLMEYPLFQNIVNKNVNLLADKIDYIKYISPQEDYDKFCENNKNNENLRSICTFYTNLMKEKVIDVSIIINIIKILFKTLDDFIRDCKKNELDELSEIIYIMVINSYESIKIHDSSIANEIINKVHNISIMSIKTIPGITNKCIFKHMDIYDELS